MQWQKQIISNELPKKRKKRIKVTMVTCQLKYLGEKKNYRWRGREVWWRHTHHLLSGACFFFIILRIHQFGLAKASPIKMPSEIESEMTTTTTQLSIDLCLLGSNKRGARGWRIFRNGRWWAQRPFSQAPKSHQQLRRWKRESDLAKLRRSIYWAGPLFKTG